MLFAGVLAGIASGDPAAAQAPSAQAARYPLDPVCPWGRLADGHGLLVRCLERGEAQGLLAGIAPTVPPTTAVAARPPAPVAPAPPHAPVAPPTAYPYGVPAPAAPPHAASASAASPTSPASPAAPSSPAAPGVPGAVPRTAPAGNAPADGAPAGAPHTAFPSAAATASVSPAGAAVPLAAAPGAPPAAAPAVAAPAAAPAAVAPRSTKIYRRVSVREVGAAIADTGELPEAQVQLRKAQERYTQCVANNGGLEGEQGQVTVRFLVRERGRAEGVAVKDRVGVSLAAAKCVAEVVDRRFVGYPAEPIVGATLSIDFVPEGTAR